MKKKLSEFDLIKSYFAPLTKSVGNAFGLTDDAALIETELNCSLVVTTDTIVQNVHFLSTDQPGDIAAKLLRVSLSDLASMGAEPAFYNIAMSLKPNISVNWIKKFTKSLGKDQEEFGIYLIGGDTVSSKGPLTFTTTAFGLANEGRVLRRNGAKFDDDIWISGSIGDGSLGLKVARGNLTNLSKRHKDYLLSRYRRPIPRTKLALELLNNVNSAIDVSDGLISDLGHICHVSNVGAEIKLEAIPTSPAVTAALNHGENNMDLVLNGGDDYELLFTAESSFRRIAEAISNRTKVRLTRIGKIVEPSSVRVLQKNGQVYRINNKGYIHF